MPFFRLKNTYFFGMKLERTPDPSEVVLMEAQVEQQLAIYMKVVFEIIIKLIYSLLVRQRRMYLG